MYLKQWQTKGGNKYHAKKQIYNGNWYDSKKEAGKAWELDQLVKSKQIKSYETHKKFELFGKNGTRICNYFADFVVLHNDSTLEIIDVKSKITATPVFKLKWKILEDNLKEEIKNGLVHLVIEY